MINISINKKYMRTQKINMESVIKAIETTGRISAGGNILLDEQLPVLPQEKFALSF